MWLQCECKILCQRHPWRSRRSAKAFLCPPTPFALKSFGQVQKKVALFPNNFWIVVKDFGECLAWTLTQQNVSRTFHSNIQSTYLHRDYHIEVRVNSEESFMFSIPVWHRLGLGHCDAKSAAGTHTFWWQREWYAQFREPAVLQTESRVLIDVSLII